MGLNEIDYFTDCILLKQLLCVKFTTISWHPIGQLVTTGFKRSLMKLSGFMSLAVFTYFLATRENGLNMTCLSRSSSPNSHRFLISSHVKSPAKFTADYSYFIFNFPADNYGRKFGVWSRLLLFPSFDQSETDPPCCI